MIVGNRGQNQALVGSNYLLDQCGFRTVVISENQQLEQKLRQQQNKSWVTNKNNKSYHSNVNPSVPL
jgi:hypothetical protein